MMRAVIAQNSRPALVELPAPTFRPDEVLIQVRATALNRADLMQVKGQYPPPPGAPDTLGLELAGEVIAAGHEAQTVSVGQRVMALVGGGGYADLAAVPAVHTIPIPANLSFVEGAAIPEAYLTAFSNMLDIGRLASGETVLIHAAASGVGLAAMQIARVVGAKVIATASASKHAACYEHGAELVIDYHSENFADRILREYPGVDLVIDFIGAPYWDGNIRVLNKWGRLVFIGLMGGGQREVNLGDIMRKRLSIMGSTLRDRTYDEKAGLIARFSAWAMPHFEAGRLKPVVWKTLPLEAVEQAHRLMAENASAGKIVLTL